MLSAACMAPLLGPDRAPSLRAVYAAYPWSGMQFARPDVGDTVVRSVIGERDEWCLPQQVQAHMHAMTLIGCNASFRLFADAQHSFDRDTAVELVPDASVAPGAPTTYIQEDGALIHPLTGQADPGLSELDVMRYSVKSGHGRRGARIGTAGDQSAGVPRRHDELLAHHAPPESPVRVMNGAPSPHFSPGAAMIAEDFRPVRVLATESIAVSMVEGARARTGRKDRRGRGQRSVHARKQVRNWGNELGEPRTCGDGTSDLVRNAG